VREAYASKLKEALKASQPTVTTDQALKKLSEAIQTAATATLPVMIEPNKPWITQKTLALAEEKRKLKQVRQQSEQRGTEYRKKCNEVRSSARRDKNNWLQEQCQAIQRHAENNRTRETFKMIKKINRKWQPNRSSIKDKEGKMLQDREEIKTRWTEYCRTLYQDTETNYSTVIEMEKTAPPPAEDQKDYILMEEVEAAIRRLKPRKSPGPDNITGELLQAGGEALVKEMHAICNKIWKEGDPPEEWTKSVLVVIPKKGDLSQCNNYRTIALVNHMCKVLTIILLERLKAQVEPYLSEEQAGFRRDRSTIQQILILRLIAEKAKRKGKPIFNCFIDFQKAFDSIKHDIIRATFRSYGTGQRLTLLLYRILTQAKAAVRLGTELGEWFSVTVGTRQGDPISPLTFITYLERVMDSIKNSDSGISIHGYKLNNLKFADDIDLIENSRDSLEANLQTLNNAGKAAGLLINEKKTKTMVFGQEKIEKELELEGRQIENVKEFEYLGSLMTWDNDCTTEIKRRIGKATGAMASFKNIWNSRNISMETKIGIIRICIFSVLLYGCETWTLKKNDQDRLLAFEMRCYRRILHIRWQQKIRNEEVRRRAKTPRNIVQMVMKRKLNLFGHICRMGHGRLLKTVVFGMMDGPNRRGRPNREWLDDIRDWCKRSIHELHTIAQDRQAWILVEEAALDTNGH
jgi:hypothetical protein